MARGRKQSVPKPSHEETQPPDRRAVASARTAPHPAPHAVLSRGPANRRVGAVARSAQGSQRLQDARAAARLTPEAGPGTAPEGPPLPVHLRPIRPGFRPSVGRTLQGLVLSFTTIEENEFLRPTSSRARPARRRCKMKNKNLCLCSVAVSHSTAPRLNQFLLTFFAATLPLSTSSPSSRGNSEVISYLLSLKHPISEVIYCFAS